MDTPKDEDWEKDVSEFFSKLGEKNPNILYGLVLPKNEKSLCINGKYLTQKVTFMHNIIMLIQLKIKSQIKLSE